jgi:predicted metalloendopeptidase
VIAIGLLIGVIVLALQLKDKSNDSNTPAAPANPIDPETLAFIKDAIDHDTHPCDDFYQHVCGNWIDNFDLGNSSSYSYAFSGIGAKIQQQQYEILTSHFPIIGTFYDTCLDTAAIDAAQLAPFKSYFTSITQAATMEDVFKVLGQLQGDGLAKFGFVAGSVLQDIEFAAEYNFYMVPNGLTIQAPIVYSNSSYNVTTFMPMLMLDAFKAFADDSANTGVTGTDAQLKTRANSVFALEQAIANIFPDGLGTPDGLPGDATAIENLARMTSAGFQQFSGLPFAKYVEGLGLSAQQTSLVGTVYADFFPALAKVLNATSVATMQDYLRWHLTVGVMQFLESPFRDQIASPLSQFGVPDFRIAYGVRDFVMEQLYPGQFYQPNHMDQMTSTYRPSIDTMAERFQSMMAVRSRVSAASAAARQDTCMQETLTYFADFMSHEWIVADWPEANRILAEKLLVLIYDQMRARIEGATWLDPVTQQKALLKWSHIRRNVGYSSDWFGYIGLEMGDSAGANAAAINQYSTRRQLAMLHKAVNRSLFPS